MPLHVFAVVRAIPFGLSAEGVASNAPPAKINGSTNGHVPGTGASSTVEHSKRIRTVRGEVGLFKICVSIPSLTKSLSGALEQFQNNNLAKNEKHQFVEATHWQDPTG